uniref:Putative c2h2-type zn-finger protein n=1 Tax=Culex tarsalis TaxID=7177 RepID=A0A1Q3G1A1_CULTA
MNPVVASVPGTPRDKPPAKSPQLDDFCRVCLLRKPKLRPLTSQYEAVMIPEMLFKVSGTLLNILEQLPRVICERCLMKLDLAYHISEEFRKQEEKLRSFCWKGALVDQLMEYQQAAESHRKPYSEGVIEKLTTASPDSGPMPLEQVELSEEQFDEMIETTSVGSEPPPPASTPVPESDEAFEMILEVGHLETVEESPSEPSDIKEEIAPAGHPPEAATFSVELLPSTVPLKAEWVEEEEEEEQEGSYSEQEETQQCHDVEDGQDGEESVEFGRRKARVGFYPRKYKSVPNENGEFDCKECGKSFAVRKTFLNHLRRHEQLQAGTFECFRCNKCFGTKERLARHESIHERDLVCGECGHRCRNGYDYRAHIRTHQTGNFKCRRCLFSCSVRKDLLRHNEEECPRRDDPISTSKPARATSRGAEKVKKLQKCPVDGCNYMAESYGTMYVHKRAKHAPQFTCEICDKSFAFANLLREHEKLHTGEKPFQCEWCDKTFRRIFSYKEHIAVHEGVTSYDCQLCGKGFTRPRYLTAHMLTHSEERNYVCSICSNRYKTNGELTKHVRSKHEVLEYGKGDDLIEEDYNYFEDDIVM